MTRKETTKFLSDLLVKEKFSGMGKYYASEVTLNYGSADVKRVDFMQFKPPSTYSVSGIEKGEFICYEVKSCMEDYKSGHGQNFIGERNYFVMPMSLYKNLIVGEEFEEFKKSATVNAVMNYNIGVLVPIPKGSDYKKEFENPTELNPNIEWELKTIKPSHAQSRKYSLAELLFCMLRSGKM